MGVGEADPSALAFRKVSKSFPEPGQGTRLVLGEIDLDISSGEIVAVVGPSGSGKTTLLRLGAGLERPTSGSVFEAGKEVDGPGRSRGVVFQDYNVFPWLDVRENIGFALLDEVEGEERRRITDHWLGLTGLTQFDAHYPKNLSGGMRQRLAVARALAAEPRVLLADEPFGALDDPTRRSMRRIVQEAVAELGCGVFLITHDIREALLLGNRVVLLSPCPADIIGCWEVPERHSGDERATESKSWFADLHQEIVSRFPLALEGLEGPSA